MTWFRTSDDLYHQPKFDAAGARRPLPARLRGTQPRPYEPQMTIAALRADAVAGNANVGHASVWPTVGIGGVAATYPLVKGVLAQAFGAANNASLMEGV